MKTYHNVFEERLIGGAAMLVYQMLLWLLIFRVAEVNILKFKYKMLKISESQAPCLCVNSEYDITANQIPAKAQNIFSA